MKMLKIGDLVKVKHDIDYSEDPESEFYLKQFTGKFGKLIEVTRSNNGKTAFHVDFKEERIAIFYENELEPVTRI